MSYTGLGYYLKLKRMTGEQLGKELSQLAGSGIKITRQSVSQWTSGDRDIPKRYRELLEEITGVPISDLMKQDLSEADRIQMEIRVSKQELDNSYIDAGDGLWYHDSVIEDHINYLETRLEEAKLVEDIRNLLGSDRGEYDAEEAQEEFYSLRERNLSLFRQFTDLLMALEPEIKGIYVMLRIIKALSIANKSNLKNESEEQIFSLLQGLTDKEKRKEEYRRRMRELEDEFGDVIE